MAKSTVKKNDIVVVIAGADKGKSGKVLRVDRKAGRVYVEGINIQKKTMRRTQEKPQGGIMDVEGSIDISNVMEEGRYRARPQVAKAAQKA